MIPWYREDPTVTEPEHQAKQGKLGCWGIVAIAAVILVVCGLLYLMVV